MTQSTGFGLRTKDTFHYGTVLAAESLIERRYEPADDRTTRDLWNLAKALGVALSGPKRQQKIIRCLSDVCVALKASRHGLVGWPMASAELAGRPYGREVAKTVRAALLECGFLEMVQKSSKRERLVRLYRIDSSICEPWFKFRMHRDHLPVEVRSARILGKDGETRGGARLGRTRFLPEIQELELQVFQINEAMHTTPLQHPDGREFAGCHRIFNNGVLSVGGRLYGDWQQLPEEERLQLTINGDQVCEIDIKACFLSIAYARFGDGSGLLRDPYRGVRFVRECNNPERQQQLRGACKRLVNAYLCKKGELTQFPKGKRENKVTVPFRKEFELEQKVSFYIDQIKDAFPFLEQQKEHGADLMRQESEVMVQALIKLVDIGVVAFPVHDCLICRRADQEAVVRILSEVMEDCLGYVATLDVTFIDETGDLKTRYCSHAPEPPNKPNHSKYLH